MGVGTGQRAVRMLEVAGLHVPIGQVAYVGIDHFEDSGAVTGPGVPLKTAYRLLRATDAKVRLLPGDPFSVLAKHANGLGKFDLVVISATQDAASLAAAWFYLPRMLENHSSVLLDQGRNATTGFRIVPFAEIELMAAGQRSAA